MFTAKNLLRTSGVTDFRIARSVRLRSSASAYFNRTLTTPTNNKIWTFSCWFKRGQLTYGASGASGALFYAPSSGSTFAGIYFTPGDLINWYDASGGATVYLLQTAQVFRDPSAWYHLVCAYDSTQATDTNRQKIYINGVQVTSFASGGSSYVAQNTNGRFNSAVAHDIGKTSAAGPYYFDGQMTEVNFIDGQALTPSSFGATDATTGVWNPIKYTGTYGNNGFYLNFSDPTSTTTIGYDYSGNSNNWTANNISVTAGTTYDSMVDSPTNYGTDAGVGGEVRGNYCTFNPLNATDTTFSNGNLRMVTASPGYGRPQLSTFGIASGQKFYAEFVVTSVGASSDVTIGIDDGSIVPAYYSNSGSTVGIPSNFRGYRNGGGTYVGSTYTSGSPGISYTNGDKISVAVDRSANQITYYKNGSSVYTQSIASSVDQYYLCVMTFTGSADLTLNAGQTAFSYTAPSGFKALCTQNLPTATIDNGANYVAATLYTGNGTSQSLVNTVNGISFQPDLVWTKCRSTINNQGQIDSVRGISRWLGSSTNQAEDYTAGSYVTAFNSNGFSVGTGGVSNENGQTYVGWQWKASGSTVSNTAGSITSTVSANPTAGFSILTYTGTGATATIGHGLGATPSMMIMKKRSNAGSWKVYHTVLGNTKILEMNAVDGAQTSSTYWNNTSPTSTLITVGSNGDINASGETYVSYCWTAIAGYSAFISYTGNGSGDGPFVYCGFRPRWLMIKRYDATGDPWWVIDSTRSTYNQTTLALRPNGSNVEDSGGNANFDFLANGFKARTSGGGNGNESGATYIVAAFAENLFKYSRAR
jgi:hypothetical protein